MGSLDIKSNMTPSILESESTGNELSLHPPTAPDKDEPKDTNNEERDEDNPFGSDKHLLSFTSCSSSISTPDSLDDPFQDSDNEQDTSSFSNPNANDQLVTEHDEKANESSSDYEKNPIVTSGGSTTIDHASETPPIQSMERPPTTKYRIPSSVFARKKSTAPVDWSMASNESLFSIQMGGMSFCNQDSMFWKSGELALGPPGVEQYPQLFNLPPDNQTPGKNLELDKTEEAGINKIIEVEETDKNKTFELGESIKSHESDDEDKTYDSGKISNNHVSNTTEEPINSVLRDNRDNQGSKGSTADERISHHSAESGGSTKSFAFPILSGETDKTHSARIGGSLKGIPEKAKPQAEPQAKAELEPQSEPQPQTSEPKTDAPNAAPATCWAKWFPCFKCCTFCS